LSFNLTGAEAERLLKTKYYIYEHRSGKRHPATEEYSVPATIQHHIDFIAPTLHFDVKVIRNPEKSNGLKKSSLEDVKSVGTGLTNFVKLDGLVPDAESGDAGELSNCDTQTTPMCLKALYNFANYEQKSSEQNSFGIVEYTPNSYIQSDLDLFFSAYNPNATGTKPVIYFIDGAVFDTNTGFSINGESDLDLEYAIGLVNPTPVTLYQTGDPANDASFNTFLDAIDGFYCNFKGGDDPNYDPINPENCGNYTATHVISTSYTYD
jgi:tripeptidyl-peptidase-1